MTAKLQMLPENIHLLIFYSFAAKKLISKRFASFHDFTLNAKNKKMFKN